MSAGRTVESWRPPRIPVPWLMLPARCVPLRRSVRGSAKTAGHTPKQILQRTASCSDTTSFSLSSAGRRRNSYSLLIRAGTASWTDSSRSAIHSEHAGPPGLPHHDGDGLVLRVRQRRTVPFPNFLPLPTPSQESTKGSQSMLLRLKLYQLLLKITAYLLPFAGFHVGLRMWSFSWSLIGRPTNFVVHGHFGMLLFGCFVWALRFQHARAADSRRVSARGVSCSFPEPLGLGPPDATPGCRHRPVCVGCFPAPAAAFLRTLPRGGLCALAGPGNRGRKLPRV